MSKRDVLVAGVGMTPFTKPGASASYATMAGTAISLALRDAGIQYGLVQQAYAGYVYGDSTAGQCAIYQAGMTGIPIINVNNNCATGSTALFLARQAVEGGMVECALVVGFEEMKPGALGRVFDDRVNPLKRFDDATDALVDNDLPMALRYFGGAGLAHMNEFGTRLDTFAKVRVKASRHAVNNPLAVFRTPLTHDEVMASPMLWPGVMTRLMACPPTCGAAAAIVCSRAFAARHGVDACVRIRAQAMTTDTPAAFEAGDMRQVAGYGMSEAAARQVYEAAAAGPDDIDVIELHDCFAQNELISYEALGLCRRGDAERFVCDGANTYGGQIVTNPSGGLLSKGHPLGATGLAQCHELVLQLRGEAKARQVDGARLALQHNLGLGGACVVTMYEKIQ